MLCSITRSFEACHGIICFRRHWLVATSSNMMPMATGRRWTIRDCSGHTIYLAQERWDHSTAPMNQPRWSATRIS
jgi:uncharacterized protein YfaT (DUF1175 family)